MFYRLDGSSGSTLLIISEGLVNFNQSRGLIYLSSNECHVLLWRRDKLVSKITDFCSNSWLWLLNYLICM